MPISNELIDQLLQDCHSPQDLLGESGLLKAPFPLEMQQNGRGLCHQ
ncbi:hypothetical protein [Symbiopectobacterium purcellii]